MTDSTDNVFYTLVEYGTDISVGDHLDYPGPAVRDPRHTPVGQLIEDDVPTIPDMVTDRAEARLVRVVPTGGAATQDDGWYGSETGWTVQAIEPATAMLGPQAEQLTAAITKAEKYVIDEEDGELAERYGDAVDAQYDSDSAEGAAQAARDALRKAGIDADWWAETGFSCGYGTEMLALAARDLIGTTPEWTREAYEMLTEPWQSAFGPIHPEDAPA